MWLFKVLLFCAITHVSSAQCKRKNQIYTGDSRVDWTATFNGESNQQILSPNKIGFFGNEAINNVVVTPDLDPSNVMLHEVRLETRNAVEIKVVEADKMETLTASVNWRKTIFKINGVMANQVTISVKAGDGGELAIRSVYVKACVQVNWCQWSEWSTCSTSCGKGQMTRQRKCECDNPDPKLFSCPGKNQARKSCNLGPCKPALVQQFDKRLDEFEGIWDIEIDQLDQFYTKNTLQIRQGQPICRGRECVLENLEAIKAKYPVVELNVLYAVQMSEVRVYTVHTTTFYNEDKTKILPPELRIFLLWLKVGNKWEIDVLALTNDGVPFPSK